MVFLLTMVYLASLGMGFALLCSVAAKLCLCQG